MIKTQNNSVEETSQKNRLAQKAGSEDNNLTTKYKEYFKMTDKVQPQLFTPKMRITPLIEQLKANKQDFEFYPTTMAIADAIYPHLSPSSKMLDIGAGNGNFFTLIGNIDKVHKAQDEYYECKLGRKFAIEKSKILIDKMAKDIALVGTDFNNQTLIDKNVGVIFCNPPYSQSEEWTIKIIRESNCNDAFIVIPVAKWDKSELIKNAIDIRKANFKCIMKYDYRDSEYRKARTVVGVYKVSFSQYKYGHSVKRTDPFDIWFEENFNINKKGKTKSFNERMEELEEQEKEVKEVIKGKNLIERLVVLYNEDMISIISSYKSIAQISGELLNELNISKESVLESLKMRIENIKKRYWQELYKNLDVITSKLTNQSRQRFIEKLTSSTNVDFSEENAYAVICWTLKNANSYFDEQLIEVYQNITSSKNVKPYKSNHRFKIDDFRYYKDENTHYKLDYRIIIPSSVSLYSYGSKNKLSAYCNRSIYEKLEDIFTIANNLGFTLNDPIPVDDWEYGKERELYSKDGEILAAIRIYMNRNIHIKLNQKFMKAFNIEAGRLLGWLKSPEHATNELGMDEKDCIKYFKTNLSFNKSDIKLLAG